jgi:hypothetical protein
MLLQTLPFCLRDVLGTDPEAAGGVGQCGGGKVKRVVVISGAGISAEDRLKTFRGVDGLWRGYRPEEVACPEAWRRNPGLMLDFYDECQRASQSMSDEVIGADAAGFKDLTKDELMGLFDFLPARK